MVSYVSVDPLDTSCFFEIEIDDRGWFDTPRDAYFLDDITTLYRSGGDVRGRSLALYCNETSHNYDDDRSDPNDLFF